MKKKDKWMITFIVAIFILGIIGNYFIYQSLPPDKKWLIWFLNR